MNFAQRVEAPVSALLTTFSGTQRSLTYAEVTDRKGSRPPIAFPLVSVLEHGSTVEAEADGASGFRPRVATGCGRSVVGRLQTTLSSGT